MAIIEFPDKKTEVMFKVMVLPCLFVILSCFVLIAFGIYNNSPVNNRSPSERAKASPRATAAVACRDAVRGAANFGSKADFHFTTRRYGSADGLTLVEEEVDLMNGLGLMVPHTYRCSYGGGRAKIIYLRSGT